MCIRHHSVISSNIVSSGILALIITPSLGMHSTYLNCGNFVSFNQFCNQLTTPDYIYSIAVYMGFSPSWSVWS